ncbi:MAG: COG4705 family protein [Nocardioidaceae bacterium]
MTDTSLAPRRDLRLMLNKVPEVTLYFWIIKILCTTVGETAADYLNETLGFGLDNTAILTTVLLAVVLVFQFRARRYVPGIYWLAVVRISVVGTLVSDKLADDMGVPLTTTTILFAALLAITFAVWFAVERTLSIHSIVTRRRETFYWLAILFTFALGTSAGDLFDEQLGVGYWPTVGIVAAIIAVITFAHLGLRLNAVLAFWMAYILTRPLGASIGDGMAQPHSDGGLGLGTTGTSVIFLVTILALVVYLAISKVDQTPVEETYDDDPRDELERVDA